MKPIYSYALLAALAAVSPALAVDATTTPVGYVTHTIAGNVDSLPTGADTILGPVLAKPIDFAAQTTANPSGLTTLTFANGVPADLGNADYLEITSGTQEGWWSAIVSSTSTTIVLSAAAPTTGGNVSVAVRKFTTVQDFLGDNKPGLADDSGTPDEVVIVDPLTQGARSIVWTLSNGPVDPSTWVDFVSYEDAAGVPLTPGTAVILRNYSATAKTFTSDGAVKTGKTRVDLYPGDNFIAPTYAVGNTFSAMDLANQLIDQSDEVISLSAEQAATSYVSYNDGASVQMVDFVTYDPAGSLVIPEGTGLIFRRPTATPGVITFPAQVVAP